VSEVNAGWYPDPSGIAAYRFFDGNTWTRHTAAVVPAPPRHASVSHAGPVTGRGWLALSTATQIALALVIVCDVVLIIGSLQLRRLAAMWPDISNTPDVASAMRAVTLSAYAVPAYALAMLVAGVLFIIWLYQAHHSAALDRAVMRHGSGWAIGGWFVPVLNLWRPCQVARDVYRGATSRESGLVLWWWGVWLLALFMQVVAERKMPGDGVASEVGMPQLVTAMNFSIWANAVDLAAAALAIVVVQQLRSVVTHR